MNRYLTQCLWCGIVLASVGLLGGCSAKSSAEADFEQQIRAPKGPPSPEAVKAMEALKAAEARDRQNGRR